MATLTESTIVTPGPTDNNNTKHLADMASTSIPSQPNGIVMSPTTSTATVSGSQSIQSIASPSSPKAFVGPKGPKYKLITEADVQVCRLNHTRTIVSKIMNSRYLRRWESHRIILDDNEIKSTTPTGFMELAVPYSNIEDVHVVSRWDAGQKFCLRITIPDGSVLLQATSAYVRDQWLHSIQWKRHIFRSERLLKNARRPEILVKEIKSLIDSSLMTPIQDPSVYRFPLDLVSDLLQQNDEFLGKEFQESIIISLTPLLEKNHPTQEICDFFSRHCKDSPRSTLVMELFTPVVHRILKHNTDFGKYPRMRSFVQEYIQALNSQNDGLRQVLELVKSMHGPGSSCPHPRVLPNLVAVCLAAIYNCYEERKSGSRENLCDSDFDQVEWENKLLCYISMMETMSEFNDWRYVLGSLLQPIPFPDDAIADSLFTSRMKLTIHNVSSDETCGVHQTLLGIREGKEGWFNLYCPGGIACDDEGQLWGVMLSTLMKCCCKRKKFLMSISKMIGPIMLLALRDNFAAMEVLCSMLELEVVESHDLRMQMITTLQSTTEGKRMYAELCEKQIQVKEMQQKGGPKKLTLPSKSTDEDLSRMLSSGCFGNLECLSLAFTQVTSACAEDLIKLPSLRYLNLWSTQFGDQGLQTISEHLHKLQVLNLCETPVTDTGLACLASIKSLRKLNLNSTSLSALTFESLKNHDSLAVSLRPEALPDTSPLILQECNAVSRHFRARRLQCAMLFKEKLPALQECDVRYTDAW